MSNPLMCSLVAASAALVAAAPRAYAGAVPPNDYGLSWKTIGAPGNRGTLPSEMPQTPDYRSVGAVGHTYRLTQTEITNAQWIEFVRAYEPYYTGLLGGMSGGGITFLGQYVIVGNPNGPAEISWENAARYCNWLHNGKASTAEAFAQGVYDTSTFTRNPDGSYNHVLTHTADAKYWIPTLDEWVKGAYYDPHKNGTGIDGYWLYPGRSDSPPISGPPSAGGQTNAGPGSGPTSVGSYPDAQSPWGLLDTSGGVEEWTSTGGPSLPHIPLLRNSSRRANDYAVLDRLDFFLQLESPVGIGAGLRLAASIPSPASTVLVGANLLVQIRRTRAR